MICPACNNSSYIQWGSVDSFAIEQCCRCGLGITTPFPDVEALAEVNYENYAIEKRIKTYHSKRRYFEKRYRRQLKDIKKFKASGRLLDVGCNIGMFLVEAAKVGFLVTGVELNNACAEYALNHTGLDVFSDDIEHIAFPAESFDVVTMYDVLEHIPDMERILAEINRILKPGGVLVIQSPNLDSLMATMTGPSWSWLSPPDHIYHFSPKALYLLLEKCGYGVKQIKTWEPADDFCTDVLQTVLGNSLPARVIMKTILLSRVVQFLVTILQPIWWQKHKGALIEAYAVKL